MAAQVVVCDFALSFLHSIYLDREGPGKRERELYFVDISPPSSLPPWRYIGKFIALLFQNVLLPFPSINVKWATLVGGTAHRVLDRTGKERQVSLLEDVREALQPTMEDHFGCFPFFPFPFPFLSSTLDRDGFL